MIEKDPEYKDAWCYMFKEEVFEKCMKYKYTAWEGMVITNEWQAWSSFPNPAQGHW